MKPIVEIEILGKSYECLVDFNLYSDIERVAGFGIVGAVRGNVDITMPILLKIILVICKDDFSEDQLKKFIFDNLIMVNNKVVELLEIGFNNPNPNAQKLKEGQETTSAVKKN